MHARLVAVLATVSLAAPLASATASTPGWTGPDLISTITSTNADYPQVSQSPDGSAVAVWEQGDGFRYNIWANRYVPGQGWGTSTLIENDNTGNALFPKVGVDGAGNAVAVWSQTDGVRFNLWAARFMAGAGWSAPALIENTNAGDAKAPDLAVNSAGDAVAVWIQFDGSRLSAWSNTYRAGTDWSTASLLENDSAGDALSPRVALNDAGEAAAAWSQSNGSRYSVRASYASALGNWSPISTLAAPLDGNASEPHVAIFPNGTALAAWNETAPSVARVAASTYSPGNGWTPPVTLDPTPLLGLVYLDISASASGLAFASWSHPGGLGWTVWAASYRPASGWSVPQILATNASGGVGAVSVSADHDGNAIAAWSQSNGSRWGGWKSRFVPGLGWGGASPLETDGTGDAYRPDVSMSDTGRCTAVWDQHNGALYGTGSYILSASYEPPPLLVSTPASGQIFNATAVAVEGTASPGHAVAVSGLLVATRFDGTFSARVDLGAGASEVTIASWDPSGNSVGIYLPVTVIDPVAGISLQLASSEARLVELQRQLDNLQGQQNGSAAALAILTAQLSAALARLDALAVAGNLSAADLQSLRENLSAATAQLDLLGAEQDFNASRLNATAWIVTNLNWNLSRLTDRTARLEGSSANLTQDQGRLTALANGTAVNESALKAELTDARAQAAAAQERAGRAESEAGGAEAVASLAIVLAAAALAASLGRWRNRDEK